MMASLAASRPSIRSQLASRWHRGFSLHKAHRSVLPQCSDPLLEISAPGVAPLSGNVAATWGLCMRLRTSPPLTECSLQLQRNLGGSRSGVRAERQPQRRGLQMLDAMMRQHGDAVPVFTRCLAALAVAALRALEAEASLSDGCFSRVPDPHIPQAQAVLGGEGWWASDWLGVALWLSHHGGSGGSMSASVLLSGRRRACRLTSVQYHVRGRRWEQGGCGRDMAHAGVSTGQPCRMMEEGAPRASLQLSWEHLIWQVVPRRLFTVGTPLLSRQETEDFAGSHLSGNFFNKSPAQRTALAAPHSAQTCVGSASSSCAPRSLPLPLQAHPRRHGQVARLPSLPRPAVRRLQPRPGRTPSARLQQTSLPDRGPAH
ncbi:hypothetical protein PSPO01_05518 [Paraphaeosphaeria sporulosa]